MVEWGNFLRTSAQGFGVRVDPNTDEELHDILRQMGYAVVPVYFNNQQKNPELRGPIIGATIYKHRTVQEPGYAVDPEVRERLIKDRYVIQEVQNTKVLVFSKGSQGRGVTGLIMYFPDLKILASSMKENPLQRIAQVYLSHTFGSDYQEISEDIKPQIKQGLLPDPESVIAAIKGKITGGSPESRTYPIALLSGPGLNPRIFIPPNIVLNEEGKQIILERDGSAQPEDSNFKPYQAAKIKTVLLDCLKTPTSHMPEAFHTPGGGLNVGKMKS